MHGDSRGSGAGSDVTYFGSATLDWQFAKHIAVSIGDDFLHFETSDTFVRRTVTTEPAIHGPVIGFSRNSSDTAATN